MDEVSETLPGSYVEAGIFPAVRSGLGALDTTTELLQETEPVEALLESFTVTDALYVPAVLYVFVEL